MSKAVTNEEVEDVLSSIRRLVSEDKRPLAGLRSEQAEVVTPSAPKMAAALDHLVLTPALRVMDPEENVHLALEAEPIDLGAVARQTWVEPEMDSSAANEPFVLYPAPNASEDVQKIAEPAMSALDALVHETIETEAQAMDEALEDGDYGDEGYWADDAVSNSGSVNVSEDHFHDTDADWDVDSAESYSSPTFEDEGNSNPEQRLEAKEDAPSTMLLTEKMVALEAAVGETEQDWEPDGDGIDELIPPHSSTMAWEDDVELDARGTPIEEVEVEVSAEAEDEDAPIGQAIGGEDQLMDEAALRDLVSEIVRTELQGALGERITRNVRKLVRREIHRALTAQELD